jgi:potassium-transporting ATPase KdpC subunit
MKTILIALKMLLIMTILTGIAYPLIITGIGQVIFPYKTNGSLIRLDGKVTGSELIGQAFDSSGYFWSRPSACGYNPLPSGASNLGPTSAKLKAQVYRRKQAFSKSNGLNGTESIPPEMLFASGSGLDPHISPSAARIQVARIAKERNFNRNQTDQIYGCINKLTENPQFGLLGEERINVLLLNIELHKIR